MHFDAIWATAREGSSNQIWAAGGGGGGILFDPRLEEKTCQGFSPDGRRKGQMTGMARI